MRLLFGLHISLLLLLSSVLNAQQENLFKSDTKEGCIPLTVRYWVNSDTIDLSTVNTAVWDFGNGETLTASASDTVEAIYESIRRYSVGVDIDNGTYSGTYSGYINTHESLDSEFNIIKERDLPDYTYSFVPTLEITSDTTPDYRFIWEHFDDSSSIRRIVKIVDYTDPGNASDQYTYSDTGIYAINLRVNLIMPTYTCVSTTRKQLSIIEGFEVGNVYSPHSAEYFIVDPENAGVVLSFQLFSRTGIKVFEQEAPVIYWDGRTSSGSELSTGVYFYIIKSTTDDPEGLFTRKGFIHLFR